MPALRCHLLRLALRLSSIPLSGNQLFELGCLLAGHHISILHVECRTHRPAQSNIYCPTGSCVPHRNPPCHSECTHHHESTVDPDCNSDCCIPQPRQGCSRILNSNFRCRSIDFRSRWCPLGSTIERCTKLVRRLDGERRHKILRSGTAYRPDKRTLVRLLREQIALVVGNRRQELQEVVLVLRPARRQARSKCSPCRIGGSS